MRRIIIPLCAFLVTVHCLPHPNGVQTRIAGGANAKADTYPWEVSISSKTGHICNGVIYDKKYVITSADCVELAKKESDVKIIAGGVDRVGTSMTQIPVELAYSHEQYKLDTDNNQPMNNIGLIKLKTELSLNNKELKAATLAEKTPAKQEKCTLASWGVKEKGGKEVNNILQEIHLEVLAQDQPDAAGRTECSKAAGGKHSKQSFDICLKGTDDKGINYISGGACGGDSGSGVVCDGKLAALVSWNNDCESAFFATAIFPYTTWIKDSVKKLNEEPAPTVPSSKPTAAPTKPTDGSSKGSSTPAPTMKPTTDKPNAASTLSNFSLGLILCLLLPSLL